MRPFLQHKLGIASSPYAGHLAAFLISILSIFIFFSPVRAGLILANCSLAFRYEPWVHHAYLLSPAEKANFILSDAIDGADANLNPTNIQNLSIARHLQINSVISALSKALLGLYSGMSLQYLYVFSSLLFFTYLYLRRIGINWGIAISVAIGFTYGSTNMLYYGWSHETQAAVITLYFLERLLRSNKWIDCCWLMLAFLNLGGQTMVHVVVFYCFVIGVYILAKIASSEHRVQLIQKVGLAGLGSIIISLDYLWPTIYHYTNYFETGYRQNYGIRQSSWYTLVTFLFANYYGHPLQEAARWISGTYVNSGMFIGSVAFLAACSAGTLRAILQRDFYSIFYLGMILFAVCFMYELPFEHLEKYTAQVPLLRMAPPIYFKAVLHFLVAAMGALGLQFLWDSRGRRALLLGLLSALIMLCLFIACANVVSEVTEMNKGASPYLDSYLPQAKVVALVGLGCIFLIALFNSADRLRKLNRYMIAPGLISVITFETLTHMEGWIPYSRPENCLPPTATTTFLQKHTTNDRIIGLGYAGVPSIINKANYGIEMAAGRMSVNPVYRDYLRLADPNAYTAAPTQYLFNTSTNLTHPIWDLVDVRYFIAPKSIDSRSIVKDYPAGTLKAHRFTDGTVFERIPHSRHAYAFNEAEVFSSPEKAREAIMNGFPIRKKIALESNADRLPEPTSETPFTAIISNIQKNRNQISLDIDSSHDAYILISELYDPHWKAFIDGQRLKTFRSYFFLQGIQAPKGKHTVILEYSLPYLTGMNIIGACSIVFFISFFVFMERRTRNLSN